MTFLVLIAFIGFVAGTFLVLELSPFEFAENVMKPFHKRGLPIGKRIEAIKNPKPVKGIKKTVKEAREVLYLMGKEEKFGAICALSFFLMIIGLFISVLIENYLMIPVASIGMALMPFWYLIFTSHSYKKQMDAEMETALSIITTSY